MPGSGGIRVRRRSTGFEFINPGCLRLPLDQVRAGGRSDPRNPSLQQMFQMLGWGEKAGSGYPKIRQAWQDQHWRAPALDEDRELDETHLRLTIESLLPPDVMAELDRRFPGRLAAIGEVGRIALATAAIEGSVTNRRLQDLTDRHGRDLTVLLQDLCEQGLMVKAGRTTATIYTVAPGVSAGPMMPTSLGQSVPSLGQSVPSLGQIYPQFDDPVAAVAATNHAHRELVRAAILVLCRSGFQTKEALATALKRDASALRKQHIMDMVKGGLLELQYPDPNDPRQAYRAKAKS